MKTFWSLVLGALALIAAQAPKAAQAQTCGATSWDLTAGQHIDVGTVTVSNSQTHLYVTYTLDDPDYPNAAFGTLHLWAGNDLLNVPANKQGTPVPGQFCGADGGACVDATGLQTYTFAVPFSDLNIVDATSVCGSSLYVVTHAEVDLDGDASTPGHETAFGGSNVGSGTRWWFYGVYSVCCDFGPPPVPECTTAYGKGGWVWTTDTRSNPERLPSLRLTKNRWGWAININASGDTVYPIWAGAGLNKTSNGVLVGALTVHWNGSVATVTYDVDDAVSIEEIHIYAGDTAPTTIAPGQYGHVQSFDPNVGRYSASFSVSDSNGDGIWVVGHAVVCK